jgi:NAD(P)H-hydrate epimerase
MLRISMPSLEDISQTQLPQLPPRRADSYKGDYGRALVVGGSRGMSGAIALAGRAALRSGAGLVTLAVPQSVQDAVASFEPSYMTQALADENGQIARSAVGEVLSFEATAVALGPGLGRSDALTQFVAGVYRSSVRPIVVDADALYALAALPELRIKPAATRILTPHPGEFARLTGKSYDPSRRVEAAVEFISNLSNTASPDESKAPCVVLVLKGHETLVTDGTRVHINQTGNPGMATGGSGDVLTGVITGLLCQGLTPFNSARLGVHVHGLAGDLAASELGQVSLIASDLIDYLPHAFQALG